MMSWIRKILRSLKRLIIKFQQQQNQVHGGRCSLQRMSTLWVTRTKTMRL
nr:hypothetical protein DM860_001681 [Ipomoea batatas]